MTDPKATQPEMVRCPNCYATIPNPKWRDPQIERLAGVTTAAIAAIILAAIAGGVIVGIIALGKWVLA